MAMAIMRGPFRLSAMMVCCGYDMCRGYSWRGTPCSQGQRIGRGSYSRWRIPSDGSMIASESWSAMTYHHARPEWAQSRPPVIPDIEIPASSLFPFQFQCACSLQYHTSFRK